MQEMVQKLCMQDHVCFPRVDDARWTPVDDARVARVAAAPLAHNQVAIVQIARVAPELASFSWRPLDDRHW